MADAPVVDVDSPDGAQPAAEAERVRVSDKYGRTFSVPAGQVGAAVEQGFTPESAEDKAQRELQAQYGDTSGELKAAAAGAGRGLTFGLSDVALTHSGLVDPETLAKLKEANPVSSTVGEVAGAAAGLAIGPGGLLAKGGATAAKLGAEALGEGVAGRLVAKGAVGAAEGGFYGLGNTVSEETLGDRDLNAQKLAAGFGVGALLGAGGGVGAELLGTGARAAAKPIAEALDALPEQLQEAAQNRTLKAAGAIQSDLSKVSEEQQTRIARRLLDEGVMQPGTKPSELLDAVLAKKQEAGAKVGSFLDEADKTGKQFDMSGFIQRAHDDVLQPIMNDPALKTEADSLAKLLEGYQAKGTTTFREANELKATLQRQVKDFLNTADTKVSKKKLAGIFNDEIETQLGGALGDEGKAGFTAAKDAYGDYTTAAKWGTKAGNREIGNRTFSATDHLLGMAGLSTGGPIGGLLAAGANKVARERLPSALAVGLDTLAKSPAFDSLANGFSAFAKRQLSAGPAVLGDFAPVLANAMARGPTDALLTHAILSRRDPAYRQTLTQAGLDYTENAQAAHDRAVQLAALKLQLDKHDAATLQGVKAALSGKTDAAGDGMRSSLFGDSSSGPLKNWDARMATLQAWADNPEALTQRVAAGLGPMSKAAPEMASALAATLTNAVAFLAAKAPKPQNPLGNIPALAEPYAPSSLEKQRFERYARAVASPNTVLASAAKGNVSPEEVEAIQTVYPKYLDDLRQKTLDGLAAHPDALPMKQKLALSALLGIPLVPALQPQRLAQLQALHASNGPAPGQGAPAGAGGNGNRPMKLSTPGFTKSQQQVDSTFVSGKG